MADEQYIIISNKRLQQTFRKRALPESPGNQVLLWSLRNGDQETQFTRLLFHLHNSKGEAGVGLKLSHFFLPSTLAHARLKNALHMSVSRLSCISTSCVLWRVFQTGGSACSPLSTLSSELHWATDRQREGGGCGR